MNEIQDLSQIREYLDQEEAEIKVANLEEIYGGDELRYELYNDAMDLLEEKIAGGDLEIMSASSMVTMAAAMAEEGVAELEKIAAEEELEEELDDVGEVLDVMFKEAGYDLEEILECGDVDILDEATDMAASMLADLAEMEEEED